MDQKITAKSNPDGRWGQIWRLLGDSTTLALALQVEHDHDDADFDDDYDDDFDDDYDLYIIGAVCGSVTKVIILPFPQKCL